jgi:hypothetical protein
MARMESSVSFCLMLSSFISIIIYLVKHFQILDFYSPSRHTRRTKSEIDYMPSLLLVAAAYAAYKHNHNEDEDQEPEVSIDLDNKTSVLLLTAESEFGVYEAPQYRP